MNVLVVGGTGLIGRTIVSTLGHAGHTVTVSSRNPSRASGLPPGVEAVAWDTQDVPTWERDVDAVVNVSGESLIGRRWTQRAKDEFWRSRVDVNRHLATWIAGRPRPPRVFVTASAVGYYGTHPAGPVAEDAPAGTDFLARLCAAWEDAAFAAAGDRTRVVATRFGVLLDASGGAMAEMLPIWRLGLGGRVGSGRQPFPWVSLHDAARAVAFAVHKDAVSGPVNVVAPERVTNAQFTKALARAVHRPAAFIVPPVALRLRYGEGADLLSHGQDVLPQRLETKGFRWEDDRLAPTLERLVGR